LGAAFRLFSSVRFGGLIGDKAFDSNWIIDELLARDAEIVIVISQRPQRRPPRQIDAELYAWRHLIDNLFCKITEFKRVATRYDKTDTSFSAMIHLAAAELKLR
jgi:transposase